MAVIPYVSAASFRAHPTYLDTEGLNLGATSDPEAQTAELTNRLLTASQWADDECDQPLAAHVVTQRERTLLNRDGRLTIHADNTPVRRVGSVGYGWNETALTTLENPTVWIEQDANIVASIANNGSVGWSGSLQFGSPVAGGTIYAQMTYEAGFAVTLLTEGANEGALQLVVDDPTGIEPGGRYRIWEPAREEAVIVSPDWTPPPLTTTPEPTVIDLLRPLRYDHDAEHDFSGLPADARLAVVQHTIVQLMRPDSPAEDEYPDNQAASTRSEDTRTKGMGLLAEARRTLTSYRRVR
ncbi:hypothetical protein ACIP98_20915 [Streptomyces sp. NPDC088354]|uniref:hypothetical protein n=1 Tax=Streptomyces sp. NPDC088354 TaxID=3365856 RepID=UPI0038296906